MHLISEITYDNILAAFTEIPDSNKYRKHQACHATYTHAKNLSKFKERDCSHTMSANFSIFLTPPPSPMSAYVRIPKSPL